jgi:hypothetical protein
LSVERQARQAAEPEGTATQARIGQALEEGAADHRAKVPQAQEVTVAALAPEAAAEGHPRPAIFLEPAAMDRQGLLLLLPTASSNLWKFTQSSETASS